MEEEGLGAEDAELPVLRGSHGCPFPPHWQGTRSNQLALGPWRLKAEQTAWAC